MEIKEADGKRAVFLAVLFLFTWFAGNPAFGESGIYDRIGIISEHGLHGAVPEENIDLFTGNLTLRFKDIVLNAANDFDLVIWRVYNSKICKDHFFYQGSPMQQEPYSWVGIGWAMHQGRIHIDNSSEPVIEFPDGRWETAYQSIDNPQKYITRDLLVYDQLAKKLYFQDGTVWTCGEPRTIYYDATYSSDVLQVTEINNPHGQKIQIFYRQAFPIIDRIIDSQGREVDFITDDTIPAYPRLKEIRVKNSDGQWVTYSYSVNRFDPTYYHRLDSYAPPEIPASTYQYNDFNSAAPYTLKKSTTSFGGTMEYEYEDHEFYFFSSTLYTQVVKRKTIRFTSSSIPETWQYTYPTYENETGVVSVDGPVYDSQITFYGYPPSPTTENGWKIGLLKAISYSDGSYAETREWNYTQISNYYWEILGQNFGRIRAPLISKIITTRNGDAESQEEYFYERNCDDYGLPTRIKYYGGASGTTLKNYKTLEYYFEGNSTFAGKYMVLPVKAETLYNSSGTKLKETLTDYYNNPTIDNFGRIKEIKRWKDGSYLTWSYAYSITGAYDENVAVYIDLPGGGGQETYKYNYGTLAEIRRPGFTELTRTISSYTGAVKTETNQHGGIMSFSYDDLDRIVRIYMPSGFNRIDVNWSTASVGISQGTNTVIKYWDGLGRDTGYIEIGDGIDLYYRKILDAEGRVTDENKGSTSESHRYIYVLNAAGNPTRITDPLGKITNISYSSDQKTVADANSKQSIFIYEDLPGLVSRMTDAAGRTAEYTYDGAGRLIDVEYNNSRNQDYSYNGLDQVTSESHPETGTISYSYNAEGNLSARTWGGFSQTYTYNSSNQLTALNAGDETITNTYDFQGRLSKIAGSKGWCRDQIEYNSLGSITNERHYIPGMPISAYKLLQYTYDSNNNPKSILYPDGKRVEYTNNGLNMPETISFNYKNLVGAVSYSIDKQPAVVTIPGNGTNFSASYKNTGYLEEAGLQKGSTYYYRSGYTYDGVGNIISIDDKTANNFDASFSYDDLYRLTSAAYNGGKNYNYTYDYYGNLLTAKENGVAIFNKTYTTQNRISGYNYDSRGNLEQNESYSYSWDNQERLTEIKSYPTAETTGVFSYNERGLRYKAGRMPPPGILVTSPQAAEEWFTGGTYSITWLITGAMDDVVKIALFSQDGSTQIVEINAAAPNNGSCRWTVPEDIPANNYLIRIETVDDQYKDDSDIFLIKKPSLTVTLPAAGSEWVKGIAYSILWDKLGPLNDHVKISLYSTDGITLIKNITADTLNNGFYNWTVNNDINTGQYIVRIETIDGKVYDDSEVFAVFDRLIRVTAPAAGALWVHNETYTITWEVAGPVTENVDISLYKNNIKILAIASNHPNNLPYNWLIPASITPADNLFTIRVETIDGQVGDDSAVFSILAGYIAVAAPAAGETLSYGQHYTIHWEKHGSLHDYVKINLYKSAAHVFVITAGTLNSAGSFTWEIPYGLEVGDDYKIQVKTLDDLFFGDSGQFRIEEFVLFTKITEGPLVNDGKVSLHPRWFDYNLDGYLDLFVSNDYSRNMLFTNYGDGVFEDDTEIIENNVGNSEAVACGDIDNDGFPDLAADTTDYSYLYNNINGESFIEIGEQAGINHNHHSEGFNMIDYNNDGLLDLFMTLSYNGQVSKLYRNNGNKTFTDIASSFLTHISSEGSSWGDYDNDGDLDLIILTSAYNKNAFFENNGNGSFQRITDSDFIIVNDDDVCSNAAAWGDYNNDGFLDLFVANYGVPGFLYRNNGDKTFTKILAGPIATASASSLDCEWFDIDNDGRLDLLVSNFSGMNNVYRNKGGDTFERWNNIGIDNDAYYTWGSSTADYDNDGDLDVYYACYGGKNNLLYRNNIGNRENGWLSITCKGVQANASAIGAVVRVKAEIDGESIWQMRQITDRDASRASFGLGDAPIIDKIKIEWPTNPARVQILKHIDINRFLTITESSDKKIFVKSPNGGENWNAGTTHNITWSCMSLISDPVGNIKIKYSTDGGNSWTTVASDLPESGSFSWVVPNNISANCLVRVGEMDASPTDTSDAPFAICLPSSFAVTSPNGGEEWQTGSKQNITWNCSGVFDRVRIDYSLDDGLTWLEIIDFTPNDGSYEWSIPNTPAVSCLVRIWGGDADQDPPDTSDAPFSIASPHAAALKVISPNGGEKLTANTYYKIIWSSAGTSGDLKLEYSTNNGITWTEITAAAPDAGSFEWQVPDEPSAYCLVRISDPIEQLSDTSDDVFAIAANTGPTIMVISPNGGESFNAGSNQVITWTSTQYTGPVRIEYTGDGGETWKLIASSIPNNNSYEWQVPDAPADNCLVRISAADSDRSPMDVSDAPFSILPAQPAITVTSPEGGETFHSGDEVSIDWETVGIAGNIDILLRKYDDTEGYTIAGDRPYDGQPYNYVIPGSVVPGSYFIRVQQGAIVGESPSFSIVEALPTAITVTAPQAGERYYDGVTHIIAWTRTEDIADTAVKIDLYDAAGTNLITNIETSTANDGFYKWAVAPDIQSGDYTIKVQAIDGTVSGMSQVFSLNDNIPLALTGPRRGREWYRGVSHLVTWYRDEAIAGVNVSLYLYDEAGETLVQAIAQGIENAGSFAWLVDEGIPDGNYVIRIETIDGLNVHNGEVFSIGQPGDLVVLEPYECEEWLAGETHNIKWYRHDTIAGKDIELDLYDAAGEKKVGDIAVTLNDGGFEWGIDADISPGDYTIRARTVDRVEEDFSDVFTILLSQVSEGARAADFVDLSLKNLLIKSFLGSRGDFTKKPLAAGGINDRAFYSENNTKIGYNGGMESSDYYADAGYHDKRHGPYSGDDSIEANERAAGATNHSPLTINKTLSAGMIDTYYIWSYDGRLMAEYDQNGNCVKDYIYLGNRLLAEYHPATGKYYYHSQDQVGTTRIVTDDVGNVVYSAVHGPYGDIQKEWVNTYEPTQGFSGKEREVYSDMDYFGARYFDHISYRFVSVDPVRNRDEALVNPQLWNLYAYCNNNPINFVDPNGKRVNPVTNKWGVSGPAPYFDLNMGTGNIARSKSNINRGLYGLYRVDSSGTPRFHKGIDVICNSDYTVHNAQLGKVIFVRENDQGDLGRMVRIKTLSGYELTYAHLSSVSSNLQIGDIVNEGQEIGTAGISGNANVNGEPLSAYHQHLHFEVSIFGNGIDPEKWLNDPAQESSSNMNLNINHN